RRSRGGSVRSSTPCSMPACTCPRARSSAGSSRRRTTTRHSLGWPRHCRRRLEPRPPHPNPPAHEHEDPWMSTRTIVHLMRHGEVRTPEGVLYGRLPEYFLSDLGHEMAAAAADFLSKNEIVHLVASPLERAQQTAEPLSTIFEVPITTDERVIEAENLFEGRTFGVGDGALKRPANWWKLRNPFRPSWGEPYKVIEKRMRAAIADAREAARGHEAVIVSHQLPVWIARRAFEKARFAHDPRNRQCSLASLTSLTFEDDQFVGLQYSEPAGHLIPDALKNKFVGGA